MASKNNTPIKCFIDFEKIENATIEYEYVEEVYWTGRNTFVNLLAAMIIIINSLLIYIILKSSILRQQVPFPKFSDCHWGFHFLEVQLDFGLPGCHWLTLWRRHSVQHPQTGQVRKLHLNSSYLGDIQPFLSYQMVAGKTHVPVDHQQRCDPPQLFDLQLCLRQPWPTLCYQVPADIQRQIQPQEGQDGDSSLLGPLSLPRTPHVDEWPENWEGWRLWLYMPVSLQECTIVCIIYM